MIRNPVMVGDTERSWACILWIAWTIPSFSVQCHFFVIVRGFSHFPYRFRFWNLFSMQQAFRNTKLILGQMEVVSIKLSKSNNSLLLNSPFLPLVKALVNMSSYFFLLYINCVSLSWPQWIWPLNCYICYPEYLIMDISQYLYNVQFLFFNTCVFSVEKISYKPSRKISTRSFTFSKLAISPWLLIQLSYSHVLLTLLSAGAAHIQDDVFLRVHSHKVAALEGQVTRWKWYQRKDNYLTFLFITWVFFFTILYMEVWICIC